jgi:hypothetical protein
MRLPDVSKRGRLDVGERQRFADPAAQSVSCRAVAGGAHDPDDLLNRRRIGVALPLVPRRTTSAVSRHGGQRAASTDAVQQDSFHDSS